MQVVTRLDNNGRIVGYVAPVPQAQQQHQQEPQQQQVSPAAGSAVATSQWNSSSSSGSQRQQTSQISIASEIQRARRGLYAQQAALTEGASGGPQGSLKGPQQFASYGSLMVLEVIADCRAAAATEAAASAAEPNPWTSSVLAVCFILRDERLQLCAAQLRQRQQQQQQLQHQQQQKEVSYSDIKGVIICDPLAASGAGPGSNKLQGLMECIDTTWWRCAVSNEKELLLQFCAVVATADPSLLIQWEAGARGLTFLSRRAEALGLGLLFAHKCSRRSVRHKAFNNVVYTQT